MLGRLKVWQKLTLIAVVMGAVAVALLALYIGTRNREIAFARKEVVGARYVLALWKPLQNLQRHRGTTATVLSGNQEMRSRLTAIAADVDQQLEAVAALDAAHGEGLGSTRQLEALVSRWKRLKESSLTLTPRQAFDEHSALIADLNALIDTVNAGSNLALDPVLDTNLLTDAVASRLPELAENLAKLRGFGAAVLARRSLTQDERDELIAWSERAQIALDGLSSDMAGIYAANPALKARLGTAVTEAVAGVPGLRRLAADRILRAPALDMPSEEYFDAATRVIDPLFTLDELLTGSILELLESRIATLVRDRFIAIGVAALGFAVGILLVVLIARSVTRQVDGLTSLFARVGIGDFKARAEVTSEDELGLAAQSLNAMLDATLGLMQSREERDAMQTSIMKLLKEVSGVAQGDLTQEAEVTADMTGAIADSFNYMIAELRRVIGEVHETTVQVGASASEIQATAVHLATGSEAQSAQIIDTSAAIDEMAASIQQVSESAAQSAQVAEQARTNAREGARAVERTTQGMASIRQQVQETAKRIKRLGESSQEIGEIVQLIGDIADRTSILALNASIQAAMAGEAGRGFAVVAEEVERLADRSTEATKRIATLIKTTQTETSEAVAAMEATTREVVAGSNLANEALTALAEIQNVSNRLAELIQSISLAGKQQARGSDALAKSMSEISQITQETAAGNKQAAVSISNLARLANDLRASLGRFKLPAVAGAR